MSGKDKSQYSYMLVGKKFFDQRLGRKLFYPEYRHFFADTELGEYAKSIGRFMFCEEAQITHYHPSTGAQADATHTEGRCEKWEHDHYLYLKRKSEWLKNGFVTFADDQLITR
jgi:GT2 family glycosyltransferase